MNAALPELKKIAVEHPRFRERVLPDEIESAVPNESVRDYYDAISDAIALEENDPLRYGFEPEIWLKADEELRKFREENPIGVLIFVVLGGIRSSKTEWRSKRTVEAMLSKKDYKVWASHSTQESSREAQQSKIHRYIPPEYKSEKGRMRIGSKLKVNYTPWGGFTEDTFAFPSNAGGVSECRFKFYSMNPRSLEGAEINEGWLDEQAAIQWLNAFIGRATTRNGIVFLTFAAIDGYTPLVRAILDGATTIEECEAKLLPIKKPRTIESGKQENRNSDFSPEATNGHKTNLPVPVLAEPQTNRRLSKLRGSDEVRESNEASESLTGDSRGGQNNLGGGDGSDGDIPRPVSVDTSAASTAEREPAACKHRRQSDQELCDPAQNPSKPKSNFGSCVPAFLIDKSASEEMETVGYQMVPRVQENLNMTIATGEDSGMRLKAKARIVYFHTSDNPYGNPDSLAATLEGASEEKIKMMFYGVPTRAIAAQFNYKDTVHKMSMATYRALVEKLGNKGPRYQLIDPCSGRNWFMLWIWFWAPKRAIVYREWPSTGHPGAFIEGIGDPGPWAVPGNSPDGDRGEAQRPFRFGYERYLEEIAKAEGWFDGNLESSIARQRSEVRGQRSDSDIRRPTSDVRHPFPERISERLVDGRYAVSPTQMREGATTWIQQMADLGLNFVAMRSEKQILSGESDGSVEMINRALSYDVKVPIGEFSAALGAVNEPSLHILETCTNTRFAFETWTGRDGAHGACKDPIDTVRGAYLSELDYFDETAMKAQTPWLSQFSK